MKKRLVIIGASGHGKVIADIAEKNGYKEIIFLDDNESLSECAGFPVVGKSIDMNKFRNDEFIVAIGNAKIRAEVQKKLIDYNIATLIHPNAVISRRVKIGKGTVIMAGTIINSDVEIGEGCIINTGSSVDHDCIVADYVHVSVGAHIAGNVKIGERTWIGAGSTVSNNVAIYHDCIIGAGAVVVKDVEEQGTFVGVPAIKIIH